MLLIISVLVIALVIGYIIARKFSEIAEMKGHDGRKYFWFTFLFGICGMLMVDSLPNLKGTKKTSRKNTPSFVRNEPRTQPTAHVQTSNTKDINKSNPPVSAVISNGEKVCPMCGESQRADRRVCWSCGQRFDN